MREIKTTIYCDRCGKKITDAEYRYAIDIFCAAENCSEGDPKDLCLECTKSFGDWMEEKAIYVYQVRHYSKDKDKLDIKQRFKSKDEATKYIEKSYPNSIYEKHTDVWLLSPDPYDKNTDLLNNEFVYIKEEKVLHES